MREGADDVTGQLIERVRTGDAEAYQALFERHHGRVLLYLELRMGARLRARVDAVDLLQETFLEAHKAFARFEYRGAGSFPRWLCRIAERVVLVAARRENAEKRRPRGDLLATSSVLAGLRSGDSTPSARAARRERAARLRSALEALPAQERTALLFKFFQQRGVDDLAAELKVSRSTAKRLIARGLLALGRVLREEGT